MISTRSVLTLPIRIRCNRIYICDYFDYVMFSWLLILLFVVTVFLVHSCMDKKFTLFYLVEVYNMNFMVNCVVCPGHDDL